MLQTISPDSQAILTKYQYIWSVAVPSMPELNTLLSELGTVAPITWKRFPRAFSLTLPDRVLNFRDREEAWDWYLKHTGIAKPVILPWQLPYSN